MTIEPSSTSTDEQRSVGGPSLSVGWTCAVCAWFLAALLGWMAGAGTSVLLIGLLLQDIIWLIGATLSSPVTPDRFTINGDRLRGAQHAPHLVCLAALGVEQTVHGANLLAQVASVVLIVAALANFAHEATSGELLQEHAGSLDVGDGTEAVPTIVDDQDQGA